MPFPQSAQRAVLNVQFYPKRAANKWMCAAEESNMCTLNGGFNCSFRVNRSKISSFKCIEKVFCGRERETGRAA